MRTPVTTYKIHSEARAGHWVAWVTAVGAVRPAGSIILPGQTQQEAESNARRWIERINEDPRLAPS